MNDKKQMQIEYQNAVKKQKRSFCHTMNMSKYKILCEDFFANSQNIRESVKISEEANSLFMESEDKFLHWLELE